MITCIGIAVHLAVAGEVFDDVFLCCPFSKGRGGGGGGGGGRSEVVNNMELRLVLFTRQSRRLCRQF